GGFTNGQPVGDVLVVGTRGSGAWKIDNFSLQDNAQRPELTLTTESGVSNYITLSLNPSDLTEMQVFLDGKLTQNVALAQVYRIVVNGTDGDDTLQIDGRIHVAGGVVFNSGDATNPDSRLIVVGQSTQTLDRSLTTRKDKDKTGNGTIVVTDAAG